MLAYVHETLGTPACIRAVELELTSRPVSGPTISPDEQTLATMLATAGNTGDAVLVARLWAYCETLPTLRAGTLRLAATAIRRSRSRQTFEHLWAWRMTQPTETSGATVGALALACVAFDHPEYLESLWQQRITDSRGLGALAIAASEAGSEHLLERVWQTARSDAALRKLPIDHRVAQRWSITWCSFAKAAARLGRGDLLTDIWGALKTRGNVLPNECAAFAAAAAAVRDHTLLSDACEVALTRSSAFSSKNWGELAHAVGELRDATLLRQVWQAIPDRRSLAAEGWGVFANAAGNADDALLLSDIFEAWPGKLKAFAGTDHAVWASFLAAASRLRHAELFMRLFRTFESSFDPARWPSRGSLQPVLWSATSVLPDEDALIVAETLVGLRVNVDAMFQILREEKKDARYDGAARCLAKWLVNSYFRHDISTYRTNLRRLAEGTLALPGQTNAWVALFSRGKEAFVGGLLHRQHNSLESLATAVTDVADEALPNALDGSEVVTLVADFLGAGLVPVAPEPWQPPAGAPAWTLEPLVTCYRDNLAEYLLIGRERHSLKTDARRETYFATVRQCLQAAGIEQLTAGDWMDAWHWAITTTGATVWPLMDHSRWQTTLHQSKRRLQRGFEAFRTASTPDERLRLALSLKRLLRGMWVNVNARDWGPATPLTIASMIRAKLVGRRGNLATTTVDIPATMTISAWEGARTNVLEPMFFELRHNIDRALAALPAERQFLSVTVAAGTGPEEGYTILRVANAYHTQADDRYSTGLGVPIVQRLATLLSGARTGYATFDADGRLHGELAFTVSVYFPVATL